VQLIHVHRSSTRIDGSCLCESASALWSPVAALSGAAVDEQPSGVLQLMCMPQAIQCTANAYCSMMTVLNWFCTCSVPICPVAFRTPLCGMLAYIRPRCSSWPPAD
jgi:hypothetical protein